MARAKAKPAATETPKPEIPAVIQSITIIGRRWLQRTYGNTYFTAVGIVNGRTVVHLPMEYGYGDHYADRTWEELIKLGFIPDMEPHEFKREYCERKGIAYTYSATDVARERDL